MNVWWPTNNNQSRTNTNQSKIIKKKVTTNSISKSDLRNKTILKDNKVDTLYKSHGGYCSTKHPQIVDNNSPFSNCSCNHNIIPIDCTNEYKAFQLQNNKQKKRIENIIKSLGH